MKIMKRIDVASGMPLADAIEANRFVVVSFNPRHDHNGDNARQAIKKAFRKLDWPYQTKREGNRILGIIDDGENRL